MNPDHRATCAQPLPRAEPAPRLLACAHAATDAASSPVILSRSPARVRHGPMRRCGLGRRGCSSTTVAASLLLLLLGMAGWLLTLNLDDAGRRGAWTLRLALLLLLLQAAFVALHVVIERGVSGVEADGEAGAGLEQGWA